MPRVPPSANELNVKYRSHFAYRDLRVAWEKDLKFSTHGAQETQELKSQAKNHEKLKLSIRVYRKRELDYDNLIAGCKPVIDALKNVGYLNDDDSKSMEVEIKQASPFKPHTVIEITPCEAKETP